jgi:hypothetical protein
MKNSALHTSIEAALAKGMTVVIATAWRKTAIKAKHVTAWGNTPFFKTDARGMTRMIARTSRGEPVYDIIDGCKITAS